jgi:reverse gyrase
MPTGTGKTETMLALNARQRFDRLLVVVPTDALREQIAAKFETFGVLKAQSCLDASALFPVVTRLTRHAHCRPRRTASSGAYGDPSLGAFHR